MVFVGINPGRNSAETGHSYAGPGNLFWPLLYRAGFVTERLTWSDDRRVIEWNIGLTNMVDRPSRTMGELSLSELRAGAHALRRKLLRVRPLVVCFNGKRIWEVFSGHAADFGLQAERIGDALVFVMPSTSARTAAYQRPDKLRSFRELKRVVDQARAERPNR